jgi:hypothetical protein
MIETCAKSEMAGAMTSSFNSDSRVSLRVCWTGDMEYEVSMRM